MHNNISFFIPFYGCPHRCSFCDQHTISGEEKSPEINEIREELKEQLEIIKNPENTEIAFFGGTFTAIPENMMRAYLDVATEFVGENKFYGIRMSTRPDAINEKIMSILREYPVTAIELGAQSMCDDVLELNERGHSAKDVKNASALIKNAGYELGLQMMTGLYGSDSEKDIFTAKEIAELKPSTVRIYPTVIIKGTKLADYFENGDYKTVSIEEMAETVGKMIEFFENKNIKVIKCGLHSEKSLEESLVGGYYHPAFRELAESTIYRRHIEDYINKHPGQREYIIEVPKGNISKASGHKKSNRIYFEKMGFKIKFKEV